MRWTNVASSNSNAVFYAAFVIRKLIENKQITDKVAGYSLNAFRSRRPKEGNIGFALSTSCDLDKEFEIERPCRVRMAPSDLTAEIIHNHKLMWDVGDDGHIVGIYLCSYQKAADRLILLPLDVLHDVIAQVANDAVIEAHFERITGPSADGAGGHVTIRYVLK